MGDAASYERHAEYQGDDFGMLSHASMAMRGPPQVDGPLRSRRLFPISYEVFCCVGRYEALAHCTLDPQRPCALDAADCARIHLSHPLDCIAFPCELLFPIFEAVSHRFCSLAIIGN